MKAAGEIWLLSDKKKETIAYPNDLRVTINVDDDLKQLFREIELPHDMLDIEEDLVKNRMKPATDTVKRRMALALIANSEPKKKVIDFSKKKLTNSHLPELFKLASPALQPRQQSPLSAQKRVQTLPLQLMQKLLLPQLNSRKTVGDFSDLMSKRNPP